MMKKMNIYLILSVFLLFALSIFLFLNNKFSVFHFLTKNIYSVIMNKKSCVIKTYKLDYIKECIRYKISLIKPKQPLY